jgi:hypothetical protein
LSPKDTKRSQNHAPASHDPHSGYACAVKEAGPPHTGPAAVGTAAAAKATPFGCAIWSLGSPRAAGCPAAQQQQQQQQQQHRRRLALCRVQETSPPRLPWVADETAAVTRFESHCAAGRHRRSARRAHERRPRHCRDDDVLYLAGPVRAHPPSQLSSGERSHHSACHRLSVPSVEATASSAYLVSGRGVECQAEPRRRGRWVRAHHASCRSTAARNGNQLQLNLVILCHARRSSHPSSARKQALRKRESRGPRRIGSMPPLGVW